MRLACPLMNPEREHVTSDMNLNHRHAYLHHNNLPTKIFNKPHRTLIHKHNREEDGLKLRDVNNCVSTHTDMRFPTYKFVKNYKCLTGDILRV